MEMIALGSAWARSTYAWFDYRLLFEKTQRDSLFIIPIQLLKRRIDRKRRDKRLIGYAREPLCSFLLLTR